MKNPAKTIFVVCLLAGLTPNQMLVISSADELKSKIPVLNPTISPLASANRDLLFSRLIATFDYKYEIHRLRNSNKNLADGYTVYYLRQELQALIDMWRATDNPAYLEQTKKLVFKAIADAKANSRQLLRRNQPRGSWPCFFSKKIEKSTGGHGQLYDFQGSAGFMMVATALNQANKQGWKEIADFVESNIVEKWLYFNPNITFEKLTGSQSNTYMLTVLDRARDKREHFADICLNLSELGYQKYPYRDWSKFLFDIYLTEKTRLDEIYPDVLYRSKVPADWGLYRQEDGTLIWSAGLSNYVTLDTSHANRTVWVACQAFEKGLLPRKTLNDLIISFKRNIWAVQKGPFHFNNYIDGQDGNSGGWGAGGLKGNIWLGWHRLAAYDNTLKDLFISLAYDLTNGGPNIPKGAQNKAMEEAPLCFYAWAARLLSPDGQPQNFP